MANHLFFNTGWSYVVALCCVCFFCSSHDLRNGKDGERGEGKHRLKWKHGVLCAFIYTTSSMKCNSSYCVRTSISLSLKSRLLNMFERSLGSLRDIPTAYGLSDGDDILHLGKSLLPINPGSQVLLKSSKGITKTPCQFNCFWSVVAWWSSILSTLGRLFMILSFVVRE